MGRIRGDDFTIGELEAIVRGREVRACLGRAIWRIVVLGVAHGRYCRVDDGASPRVVASLFLVGVIEPGS